MPHSTPKQLTSCNCGYCLGSWQVANIRLYDVHSHTGLGFGVHMWFHDDKGLPYKGVDFNQHYGSLLYKGLRAVRETLNPKPSKKRAYHGNRILEQVLLQDADSEVMPVQIGPGDSKKQPKTLTRFRA